MILLSACFRVKASQREGGRSSVRGPEQRRRELLRVRRGYHGEVGEESSCQQHRRRG